MSAYNCNLVSAFLPNIIFERINNEEFKDQQILGISQMLLNVAIEATQSWAAQDLRQSNTANPKDAFKGFDPNPGDSGCQRRGYLHL